MDLSNKSNKYAVKSLDKALSILELMTVSDMDLNLTDISQNLHLGKGTVHRILGTLKDHGFVCQDPLTKRYGFGLRVYEMRSSLKTENFLVKIMQPELIALSQKCGETISVSVLEHKQIRYTDRLESNEVLRVSIQTGTRFPAHCTSTGKMLLAGLTDAELENMFNESGSLKKLTENSIDSFNKLMENIRGIRKRQIAYDYEEALIGVVCLAAPIKNAKEETVAAVSISGPKERMTAKKVKSFSAMLTAATRQISKTLMFGK